MMHDDWWRGAAIYQIYPRSFRDSNGDGVGDLAGIAAKLGYIASLGVDALWISPFFVSPMRDFGYDVADHCAVDPVFGTLPDFDRLLQRAHALGLKVIVDLVCGHTADTHTWFRESRASRDNARADWYVWADSRPDGTPPNNWLSVFGGAAWHWEPRRRQYYLHHFLASQPTLNLHHPAVIEAMLAIMRFWLDRGVDGFRIDAVDFFVHDPALRDNPAKPPADGAAPAKLFALQNHIHDMVQPDVGTLLNRFRRLADEYPGAVLLGEVSSQEGAFDRIVRYTAAGRGLHMAYTLRPLRSASLDEGLGHALAEIAAAGDAGWLCWSFSNHDVERAASRWNPAREREAPPDPAFVRLLLALLLSLRGSICLYQGEELGLTEAALELADLRDPFGITYYPEFRGRDGSRTPIPWRSDQAHAGFTTAEKPWLPVPAEHHCSSVADQENDPASPLHAWRRLIALRQAHPALLHGSLRRLDLSPPLIGFERVDEAERLLCVFNPSGRPIRIALAAYREAAVLDEYGDAGPRAGDRTTLPPFGVFFAALDRAAIASAAGAEANAVR